MMDTILSFRKLRVKMRLSFVIIILAGFSSWGCSSTHFVSIDNFEKKSAEISKEANNSSAEISLVWDDNIRKGESLRFENDSLYWTDLELQSVKSYALSDIKWIQFNNRQKGGSEGLRRGALIGTSAGLVGGFIVFTYETGWFWAVPLSLVSAIFYGVGGAAAGYLGGITWGYQTTYIMDFPEP